MSELWGVLLGGVIAAGSGIGTQWFTHFIKIREERRAQKGAKLEQLVELMYEHERWLGKKREHLLFDEEAPGDNPIAKIEGICAVYFPQFLREVQKVDLAASGYEVWIVGAWQKKLNNEAEYQDGFLEAYNSCRAAWMAMMRELRKYAVVEFGTKDVQKAKRD
jgi:hypothetical protein